MTGGGDCSCIYWGTIYYTLLHFLYILPSFRASDFSLVDSTGFTWSMYLLYICVWLYAILYTTLGHVIYSSNKLTNSVNFASFLACLLAFWTTFVHGKGA